MSLRCVRSPLAPKITTADAEVRWQQPAVAVGRLIRACTPAPGAWTRLAGQRVKLGPVLPVPADETPLRPGELRLLRDGVLAGTGAAPVRLSDVQPDGKRRMPAVDWVRGLRLDGAPAVLG